MAEAATDWRPRLGRYLAERLEERIAVGEVAELFLDLIPLHHATRIWLCQRGGTDLSSPMRMRRHCLRRELVDYPLLWTPALNRVRAIEDSDVVVPLGRVCPGCRRVFFARSHTKHCGQSCARKSFWINRGTNGRYVPAGMATH